MAWKHNLRVYGYSMFAVFYFFGSAMADAQERKIKIVEPKNHAKVSNPFEVCMEVEGLILEPADNLETDGKGHHHILFSSLPANLNKPLRRRDAIHLDKAQTCIKLKMEPGKHVITALFAYGDHVPYNPPIMDKILITVK